MTLDLVIVRNACFSSACCDVVACADQWISSSLVWTEAALAHTRLSCVDKQADADADMQILVSI